MDVEAGVESGAKEEKYWASDRLSLSVENECVPIAFTAKSPPAQGL